MRTRHRLAKIAMCVLAVVSLTALGVTSAQAQGEAKHFFLIGLNTITSFPKTLSGDGSYFALLAQGVNMECSLVTFTGSLTSSTNGEGKFVFHSCKSQASDVCPVVTSSLFESLSVLLELLSSETVRFKPMGESTTLAHVPILSDEGLCTIIAGHSGTVAITGQICASMSGDTITVQLKSTSCTALKLGSFPAAAHSTGILLSSSGSKVTSDYTGRFLIGFAEIASFPQPATGVMAIDLEFLSLGSDIYCGDGGGPGVAAEFKGTITAATIGKGTGTFYDCYFLEADEVCLIEHNGTSDGTVLTETLLAELLLLAKIIRLKPLTGEIIALVVVSAHEESCPLIIDPSLEAIPIEGSVCGEIVGDTIRPLLVSSHCALKAFESSAEYHSAPILMASGSSQITAE